LLVALLFRRLVMRPVGALSHAMARLAAGDLSTRTRALGADEFALLGRHFNHMAARIEDQVARIEAARTESELLYRLVVDASKNLETNDFANGVARVIKEKLWPRCVAFFLEGAEGGWICATRGNPGCKALERGEGDLESLLVSASAQVAKPLAGFPRQLVEDACRAHALQLLRGAEDLSIALPVVSESRLVGLLACHGIPDDARVDEALLGNLGAHLDLAAVNSRNYTGAITDALTGLKNKRYGLARLEDALNFARRKGSCLGLAMCDIDHFKRVNDEHGHPAGDAVLRETARRIAACLRRSDVAVRYGGEEFMLILPEAAPAALQPTGERIRRAIEAAPLDLGAGAGSVGLTLSVGLAAFRAASDSAETLVARADAALYRAKESGRNRVAVELPEAGAPDPARPQP
ncbi:MAG: diguanylate cyclase, partial [Betaproteobacteria bacterium]|nr:diguanylate cyclase [Betaproteobacteria bacterium]